MGKEWGVLSATGISTQPPLSWLMDVKCTFQPLRKTTSLKNWMCRKLNKQVRHNKLMNVRSVNQGVNVCGFVYGEGIVSRRTSSFGLSNPPSPSRCPVGDKTLSRWRDRDYWSACRPFLPTMTDGREGWTTPGGRLWMRGWSGGSRRMRVGGWVEMNVISTDTETRQTDRQTGRRLGVARECEERGDRCDHLA